MNEELVLEAREVDCGHDVTLHRRNLSLTVGEPMDRLVPYGRLGRELEAAGRPKDLLMASEYRVMSDELRRPREKE